MKPVIIGIIVMLMLSCNNQTKETPPKNSKELADFFDKYYEERLQWYPLEATMIGDPRYNDRLSIEFTDSYRGKLRDFFIHDISLKQKNIIGMS